MVFLFAPIDLLCNKSLNYKQLKLMKTIKFEKSNIVSLAIVLCLFLGFENYGTAQTNNYVRYQQGYFKDNGTYVQPHYKKTNNSTNHDNYSTEGNTNNYTQFTRNQNGRPARQ